MISFKDAHFPKDVILFAVFFYVRYAVSYRDLEEIMEERGLCCVDFFECRCLFRLGFRQPMSEIVLQQIDFGRRQKPSDLS
jgi:hypothetical protein